MSNAQRTEMVFSNTEAAEQALTAAGFSFGSTERDLPRGVLYGDFLISKWRNLSAADRADLDGTMTRLSRGPDAPVKITLFRTSHEAIAKLKKLGGTNV